MNLNKRIDWLARLKNVGVAVMGLALATGCAPIADTPPFDNAIRATLDSLDVQTAIYAKHLLSGRKIAIHAGDLVNSL